MRDSSIEKLDALALARHKLHLETSDTDLSILGFWDLQCLRALPSSFVDCVLVKQIAYVVTVKFQKLHLDIEFAELRLSSPVLDLLKNEVENARNYTNLLSW